MLEGETHKVVEDIKLNKKSQKLPRDDKGLTGTARTCRLLF